ncbi:UNVERIFIED_CONTAM: hypothetical protein Sradi_2344600 [Sesamum radiatum]|uniref:Uncharacterized protein n=1 Tax=Sesamum radiatum TaxID=300843 RepID=A0AAW2T621_SESRA
MPKALGSQPPTVLILQRQSSLAWSPISPGTTSSKRFQKKCYGVEDPRARWGRKISPQCVQHGLRVSCNALIISNHDINTLLLLNSTLWCFH